MPSKLSKLLKRCLRPEIKVKRKIKIPKFNTTPIKTIEKELTNTNLPL